MTRQQDWIEEDWEREALKDYAYLLEAQYEQEKEEKRPAKIELITEKKTEKQND